MKKKELEKRIAKKTEEVTKLKYELVGAESYLKAMKDMLKLIPQDDESEQKTVRLRPGSSVDKTREAIKEAGKPLHVIEILGKLRQEATKTNRINISSSLANYVKRGVVFTRPAPNTYGLKELEISNTDSTLTGGN